MDDITVKILRPNWNTIYTLQRGQRLLKGRRTEIYQPIMEACKTVEDESGIYAWGNNDNEINYIGSFSTYVRGDMDTSLQGRIHNYLQNHSKNKKDNPNTNLRVFNLIREKLQSSDVYLFHLNFNSLEFTEESIDFLTFSKTKYIVAGIEQMLITFYKKKNQCSWNSK